ncbi:MAG: histidine phosphatase family protein [Lutibacter sp.]|uniref:SixA phosphatase family protein n=1 Tax=Lutibacter sp. TaxID=1925666 RepID=UPI001798C929|nr:histidine phosphatase family protein [Lutibacter sp.]MBT8316224.1 histidine phosphatase family protein [Lutibacter sp.]NNJ57084.1 histidine phosphatase family protein [Lutibacter sp.]
MKKYILLLFILIVSFTVKAQNDEVTTYYLIRHAEKVRTDNSNKNPNLNERGQIRAENWSSVFEHVNFDLIYSTNYNRTVQTAKPTAQKKDLELQFYDPRNMYDDDFKSKTTGKTVLVVGHSNTTPQFVNKILGKKKYNDIEDSNNSNLYIVTIVNSKATDTVLKIE